MADAAGEAFEGSERHKTLKGPFEEEEEEAEESKVRTCKKAKNSNKFNYLVLNLGRWILTSRTLRSRTLGFVHAK